MSIFIVFLLNFILFILLFSTFYPLSKKLKLLDHPNNRKLHNEPVPVIGGIIIYLTLLFYCYFIETDKFIILIFYCSFIIVLIGIMDDIYDINQFVRLFFQISVCVFIIIQGVSITDLGDYYLLDNYLFSLNGLGYIGIFLTVFSVLCLVNAINFIDGLDGLSGSIIIISSLTLLFFTYFSNNFKFFDNIILVLLCLNFFLYLIFNLGFIKNRKIFLGDSGSNFIGFFFSWILIYYATPIKSFIHPVLTIWCITLPIFDFLNTIVLRVVSGNSPFKPDKMHIHHIVLSITKSSKKTLLILIFISLLLNALGGLIYFFLGSFMSLISYIIFFIIYYWILNILRKKIHLQNFI